MMPTTRIAVAAVPQPDPTITPSERAWRLGPYPATEPAN